MSGTTASKKGFPALLRLLLPGLLLLVLIAAAFGGLAGAGFVNYDDEAYVTENRMVQEGVTAKGAVWALTTFYAGNWHPLTWLSHMLDVSAYGLAPRGHHLSSLILHALNALLLFLVLRSMTGSLWRSWLAAALFALHPLRVESVAWVAERKDVLAGFFLMMTLIAYVRYLARPRPAGLGVTTAVYALALMSKPVAVILPPVLLLLDWWPLGRWGQAGGRRFPGMERTVLLEKIPFLLMATASGMVTLVAQKSGGAVGSTAVYRLGSRVSNALAAYLMYAVKAVFPTGLAVFYPHPGNRVLLGYAAAGGIFLMGGSLIAWRLRRRIPAVAAGWCWYVGALVPMIGLVQVGDQARADRYTYLPLIGLSLMILWAVPHRWTGRRRAAMVIVAALALATLTVLSRRQAAFWKDSRTLMEHALLVNAGNYVAHVQLGNVLKEEGEFKDAWAHYEAALKILPAIPEAWNNMGNILLWEGKFGQAQNYYEEALHYRPGFSPARYNLGLALENDGRLEEALASFTEALRLRPDYPEALTAAGRVLAQTGRPAEAVPLFSRALTLLPDNPDAHFNLGMVLSRTGRLPEAAAEYRETLRRRPGDAWAMNNLGEILARGGDSGEAIDLFSRALHQEPAVLLIRLNLGRALEGAGRLEEARLQFEEALRRQPDSADAREALEKMTQRLK